MFMMYLQGSMFTLIPLPKIILYPVFTLHEASLRKLISTKLHLQISHAFCRFMSCFCSFFCHFFIFFVFYLSHFCRLIFTFLSLLWLESFPSLSASFYLSFLIYYSAFIYIQKQTWSKEMNQISL